ncbi:MAG: LysM peptidoglycan-binding domain-containing protein [Salinivirgaceae bacterium]
MQKKLIFSLLFIPFINFNAIALNTLGDTTLVNQLAYNNEMDSLVTRWYSKQMSPGNDTSFIVEDFIDSLYIPDFPDSVYKARLAKLPTVFDMSYNSIVRNYIHMYTHKRRDMVERMLGLSDYYFPIFEEILDANAMPMELKYLPVIESALNPNAVSRTGASGIWQFMYYTGKMYKLEVNSYVDERRDPIKSSYAAVAFMKDLYDIYQDWTLVIAAYNCGPGNVNKAIRRSGGKRDYWEIYYYLPRETRGYVPAFIAANYVMNYYSEHNLTTKRSELPILCDTVVVKNRIHLEQISHVLNITVSDLRSLNPQYRRDIVPGQGKSYVLRFPFNQTTRFIELQDSIIAYNDSIYFNPEALSKAPEYNTYSSGPPSKDHRKLYYSVKSGDNLGFIANWYGVNVADLRNWNNIYRNTIRGGQKLTVYVHKNKVASCETIDDMTFEQKQARIGKSVVAKAIESAEAITSGDFEYYTVRSGDTLWDIAKQYPGVTDTDIMRWNGMSNGRNISIGQQLKIKVKG